MISHLPSFIHTVYLRTYNKLYKQHVFSRICIHAKTSFKIIINYTRMQQQQRQNRRPISIMKNALKLKAGYYTCSAVESSRVHAGHRWKTTLFWINHTIRRNIPNQQNYVQLLWASAQCTASNINTKNNNKNVLLLLKTTEEREYSVGCINYE